MEMFQGPNASPNNQEFPSLNQVTFNARLDTERFPVLTFKGSPEELGWQHGRLLRDRVENCFEFYRERLFGGVSDSELKTRTAYFTDEIRRFSPSYDAEIHALSEGACLEPWQITMLNARTELYLSLSNECTAFYFRNGAILGQNWDWARELEDLAVILRLERDDGHTILTMTEPGILGKIGLNSAGVGVCLNILNSEGELGGVPFHILLRSVLDAPSLSDAMQTIQSAHRSTMSNLLMADAQGQYVDLEFSERKLVVLSPNEIETKNGVAVHSNGYLHTASVFAPQESRDSELRLEGGRRLALQSRALSAEDMQAVLVNAEVARPWEVEDGQEWGTVTSIVMDLPQRVMHITPGNPFNRPYQRVHLYEE